jgi:hypothetical protein
MSGEVERMGEKGDGGDHNGDVGLNSGHSVK